MTLEDATAVSSVATGRMLGMSVHSILARDHSIVQIWRKDARGQLNLMHLQYFGADMHQTYNMPIPNPSSFQNVAPVHAHCVTGHDGQLTRPLVPQVIGPNKVVTKVTAKKVAKEAAMQAAKNAAVEANLPKLNKQKVKIATGSKRNFEDISSDESGGRGPDLVAAAAAAAKIQHYAAQQCANAGGAGTSSQG